MRVLTDMAKILLLVCLWAGFWLSPAAAAEQFEEMSTADMSYVRGLVSRVDAGTMQISVRPAKGSTIRMKVDADTLLEGVARLDELEKEMQVKVWYTASPDGNRAVKIVKIMNLGC